MDFPMLRSFLATTAMITALSALPVTAQQVSPGFDPDSSLPTVSLPQRSAVAQGSQLRPETTARRSPEVSTTISRSGGTQTATDMKKAPDGALEAAASTQKASTDLPETAPGATESKYRAGMVIYGTARAYDGHSLLVDGNPLRLNGIEAPGMKQTCSTAKGTTWKCGQKAFEKLSALVNGGKVKCVVVEPAGHGAAAACSAAQSRDVGAILVAEGLALPNRHSAGTYNSAAAGAMKAGRGMWMGPFKDPAKWRMENRQ